MDYLCETPWWLLGGLLVLGGVLFWTGRTRAEKRVMYGGVGAIVLAIILGVVSWVLDSPREKAIRNTRALVAAVVRSDEAAMRALLHERISTPYIAGRDAVIKRARELVNSHGVTDASVLGIDGQQEGKRVAITMRLAVVIGGMTVPSDWELRWEEVNGQWVLRDAEPGGERRDDVRAALRR